VIKTYRDRDGVLEKALHHPPRLPTPRANHSPALAFVAAIAEAAGVVISRPEVVGVEEATSKNVISFAVPNDPVREAGPEIYLEIVTIQIAATTAGMNAEKMTADPPIGRSETVRGTSTDLLAATPYRQD
jgi:hypothetical protein